MQLSIEVFARAVGANNGADFASKHVKLDLVQHGRAAKRERDILHL